MIAFLDDTSDDTAYYSVTFTYIRREGGVLLAVSDSTGATRRKFISDTKEIVPNSYDYGTFEDECVRSQRRHDRMVATREFLGQRIIKDQLAWWPLTAPERRDGQVLALQKLGLFAGARDWTRGRHWDRRSRYGLR